MCKDMYITFDINTFNNFGADLAWTLKTLQLNYVTNQVDVSLFDLEHQN
jgi:hypothetical protein